MISLLKQILWIFLDRCGFCGGGLDIWDSKHSTCYQCNKSQF